MADQAADFLRKAGLLYDAVSLASEYDYQNKVVQFDDDPNRVASGEATILFSGPPVLSKILGANTSPVLANGTDIGKYLVPIGAVQGFQDSETPNIVPFPEIGSRLKRFAVGMASYQVSMSRVITLHSNLRHALYAWMALYDGGKDLKYIFAPGETFSQNEPTNTGPSEETNGHLTTSESDLMRIPFGLLLVTMSAGGHRISREYYEKCYVQNIGKSVGAGQPLIQENVSIICTRKVPCNHLTIDMADKSVGFKMNLGQGDGRLPAGAPDAPAVPAG